MVAARIWKSSVVAGRRATARKPAVARPPARLPLVAGRWPAWAALVVGLGVALRIREYVAGRSLWLDESMLALELIEKSPRELLGPLGFTQGAPPGFLLGEKALAAVLGYSELALRLLPLVCGILALIVFFPAARRSVRPSAVPIALLLVAVADGLVYYSAELKQYSVDVFVSLCLLAAAAPLARVPIADRAAPMIALGATPLILMSHASVFVATACGVVITFVVVAARAWDEFRQVLPVVATWGAACLLLIVASPDYEELRAAQSRAVGAFVGEEDGLADPSWIVEFGGSLSLGLGLPGGGPLTLVAKVLSGVALVGFLSLVRRDRTAAALLVLPIAITVAVSALDLYPVFPRTVLFLVPIVALLLAEGAVAIASLVPMRHRRAVLAAAAILVLALPTVKAAQRFVGPPVTPELKPALSYVRDRLRENDVLYVSWGDHYSYLYYVRCGCFDLQTRERGLPTSLIPLSGIASQRHAAFRSTTPLLVVSRVSSAHTESRLDDLDRLRGRGRVWVLSAQTVPGDGSRYHDEFLPHRLDRLGRRLDAYTGEGGRAYLYDFGGRSPSP